MAPNTRQVLIGVALLVASTVFIFSTTQLDSAVPAIAGSLAALGLAVAALLIGTSGDVRPV